MAIERKKRVFIEQSRTKKAVFVTLITSFGAKATEHYFECVDNQLTLDNLYT